MSNLYNVKKSPGKGLGVFAARDIEPGTVIMHDSVAMKIERPEHDVTDKQVQEAFKTLSYTHQSRFRKLHEGNQSYKTELLRIFKSNAFGDETHAWIYLKIARLNHACAPNAEITETDNETDTKVVGLKPIAKDEEVHISYNGALEEGSKAERAQVMKDTYGFECDCAVCNLRRMDAYLSDGRRRLINAISHKLEGFEPTHLQNMSSINGVREGKILGRHKQKLRVPLTIQEKTAYNFLKAKLLEAEGMICYELVKSYVTASLGLFSQLKAVKSAVIIPSAGYVISWLVENAILTMTKIRGAESKDMRELQQAWSIVQKNGHVKTAWTYMNRHTNTSRFEGEDHSKTFAIEFGGQGRLLSRDECKELIRKENPPHAFGA